MSADERIPVWLDCDPGHDDAIAMILAGYNPKINLLGISTVAGNQTVQKVTHNAIQILYWSGLQSIPVYSGCHKPLLREAPILCPEIHGDSGLDGPLGGPCLSPVPADIPPILQPGKAVVAMFQHISAAFESLNSLDIYSAELGEGAGVVVDNWFESASDIITNGTTSSTTTTETTITTTIKKVKLVATGALTNVALLLSLYPEIYPMIEIVIMGGCLGVGNTGPVVEFNIQTDPEAAKLVFEAGIPLTMIPLEVTHTALATPTVLTSIQSKNPESEFLTLMNNMLTFFAKTYKAIFKFEHPPLHDPCAVAFVIAPELFSCEFLRVDIEVCSVLSAGQTVVDMWKTSNKVANVNVAMGMDVEGFWKVVVEALHAADERAPFSSK